MKYRLFGAVVWFTNQFLCQGSNIHWMKDLTPSISFDVGVRRGLPDAPNEYAPEGEICPEPAPSVRSADALSLNETSWLQERRNKTRDAMVALFGRLNMSDFDAQGYLQAHAENISALPNIAISLSGGGYRAMLNGAGAIAAFDSRTENSGAAGHLGGILQSTTYLSGLSGGSWLVGSIYMNNFTTISALLSDNTGAVWDLENSIIEGPPTVAHYYKTLVDTVRTKEDAGFNTSITDYWGRALSYQLINTTDGGVSYTWSSVSRQQEFLSGNTPMPIVIAVERSPGELVIASNASIFEFNPWELGTFDPTTYGFVPLGFIGSNFSSGELQPDTPCIEGYDNAGFIMGTSSSLFNQGFLLLNGSNDTSILSNAITNVLAEIGESNNDISIYSPNPFYRYNTETNPNAESTTLFLVDGGEDLQNIPFHPVIQSLRDVDVVFAVDSSADTDSRWPNGTSMVATYRRSLNPRIANGTVFPSTPDQNTFVNLGLNSRPTFFGCDANNMTGPGPLIVYLPNFPYSYYSNVSTFDLEYNNTERDAIVQNGYNVATLANGSVDSQWPACVGCAILARSLERTGVDIPKICEQCFTTYCWNGSINATTPQPYNPVMLQTVAGDSDNATSDGEKLLPKLLHLFISFWIGLWFIESFVSDFC